MVEMKVKPEFLRLLRAGIKKNEYRLNHPKYDGLNVGDTIKLVCDNNPDDFIFKKIKGIKTYYNWIDALMDNWESDFKGLFYSLDQLLQEVGNFYTQQEINKYGIKVFNLGEIDKENIEYNSKFQY